MDVEGAAAEEVSYPALDPVADRQHRTIQSGLGCINNNNRQHKTSNNVFKYKIRKESIVLRSADTILATNCCSCELVQLHYMEQSRQEQSKAPGSNNKLLYGSL